MYWDSERPNELWIGHREKPNELLIRDPSLLDSPVRSFTSYPGGHNEGFPDTFKQCFRAFYDYIEEGDYQADPSFPSLREGYREVLLCEAVLKSHREERWVSIEEDTR